MKKRNNRYQLGHYVLVGFYHFWDSKWINHVVEYRQIMDVVFNKTRG